jgi:diaminohydroxyphosphoribosylaminopyrimidine deaminase/5-amino-6-(5-phosphoribosylamino)uracil reductase
LLDSRALIFTASRQSGKIAALSARGAEVVVLPNADGRVDLTAMLMELGSRGINEVLAEAGARLNAALLHDKLVDELLIYQAPLLLGDQARGMAALPPLASLTDAQRLIVERRMVGVDQHPGAPDGLTLTCRPSAPAPDFLTRRKHDHHHRQRAHYRRPR